MVADTYECQDIAFASFLLLNGHTIHEVKRRGRRVIWVISIPEEDLAKLEADWPASDLSRFFTMYQTLKSQLRIRS